MTKYNFSISKFEIWLAYVAFLSSSTLTAGMQLWICTWVKLFTSKGLGTKLLPPLVSDELELCS